MNHLSLFSGKELHGDSERSSALVNGAQGPDIFYHNQRTMPSGLLIGSLLHRRGYGSVSAAMLEYLLLEECSPLSPEAIYLYGFISHGVMDRIMHPYINYFSGWINDDDNSRMYRDCHPFFERIIDTALAVSVPSSYGADDMMWSIRGNRPRHYSGNMFSAMFDRGETMHPGIHRMLSHGLRSVFSRLRNDGKLETRIQNAYADSRGFYRFCEEAKATPEASAPQASVPQTSVPETSGTEPGGTVSLSKRGSADAPAEGKHGWEDPGASRRWKALSHPDRLPDGPDYANLNRSTWYDPCDGEKPRREGLGELYARSLREAAGVLGPIISILQGADPPDHYPGVPDSVGDHGLRSSLSGETPCTMVHMDPLPLYKMLEPGEDLPGSPEDVETLFAPLRKRIR
ncbi:hypothetical protein [Salinispira pacifica]|uniref:Phospholipase C/D domain-containing protein n=1 Tax=Salinispira pacifica TaxID=1307761 RepID=V5WKV5_9SPIO|nr:hypothetical protein [Salinispira pacifica]AHC15826.1 hypothetical protein L21SP2_2473 [Salinispira pacifica]